MFRRSVTALLLVMTPLPILAAPVASGLENVGRPVTDEQLAEMRGKFISPSNVSYFGVQMQTGWQGPDGITTSATLVFSVDFANGAGTLEGATPTLAVGYDRSGDPSMDVANVPAGFVAIAVPAGLAGTQGAVQNQQIAGNDNRVQNDMRIAIVPASSIQPGGTSGLTVIQTGQSVQFADGDTLQFVLGANQVGLQMTGAGTDAVRQGFDGAMGQAAQHVLLSSSGNQVRNGMGIVIGFDALAEAGQLQVQNALSAMKGLGF